jgi:hypothetical protein
VSGFRLHPPVIVAPPRSVIVLLILLLLAPVLLGSTILLRSVLMLILAAFGIGAAVNAIGLVLAGQRIEVRSLNGGLGGGSAGWRLSQPASLLLVAAILIAAAVGLAQADRHPEPAKGEGRSPTATSAAGNGAPATTAERSGISGQEAQTKTAGQPTSVSGAKTRN